MEALLLAAESLPLGREWSRRTRLSFRGGGRISDSVSFPTRDGSAARCRPRICKRFNFRADGSDPGASISALLFLLLTRFSRQLPLLSCLLIVRLRHATQRSRIQELAQARRSQGAELHGVPLISLPKIRAGFLANSRGRGSAGKL